mmetsp:Transcript_18190/g.36527  ORF Transcript_18190/g.36527 Transcript_18190/m.36527 type:complete len:263 (-) Transcript_18190:13-801(-)
MACSTRQRIYLDVNIIVDRHIMRSVLGTAILIENPSILRIRVSGDETFQIIVIISRYCRAEKATDLLKLAGRPNNRVVRSRVERPILRRKLLTLLDEYNELYDSSASRVGLPRKLANRVAVLSDSCVAKVFSSDMNSLSAFRRASGVLISTSLSIQFQDRRNILCDTDFWSLWDIIVMRSGWVLIDVQQFNSAFNGGGCRYLGLIRFLPSLLCGQRCCTSSGLCRVPLCTMSISRLCSSDGAYSACGDIWSLHVRRGCKEAW